MSLELNAGLIAAALIGGYLLGSIPFGVLVMRAAGAGDPRAIGSGNIGATNVLRSGRKGLAPLTTRLDCARAHRRTPRPATRATSKCPSVPSRIGKSP